MSIPVETVGGDGGEAQSLQMIKSAGSASHSRAGSEASKGGAQNPQNQEDGAQSLPNGKPAVGGKDIWDALLTETEHVDDRLDVFMFRGKVRGYPKLFFFTRLSHSFSLSQCHLFAARGPELYYSKPSVSPSGFHAQTLNPKSHTPNHISDARTLETIKPWATGCGIKESNHQTLKPSNPGPLVAVLNSESFGRCGASQCTTKHRKP
jgi:hypothetical protein